MTTDFESQLQNIQSRMDVVAKRQDELGHIRRQHALAATVDNDRVAIEAIRNVEAESLKLDHESRNLVAAIASIHEAQREAKAEAERRDLERKQSEDKEDRTSMLAAATAVDQHLNALVTATAQYVKLAAKVKANGIVPSGYIQRLYSKGCLTSAANAARLGDHYEMGLTTMGQRFTLAEHCHGLFAKDAAPTPVASKRKPDAPAARPNERYIG
jgi:hypothetical protein